MSDGKGKSFTFNVTPPDQIHRPSIVVDNSRTIQIPTVDSDLVWIVDDYDPLIVEKSPQNNT